MCQLLPKPITLTNSCQFFSNTHRRWQVFVQKVRQKVRGQAAGAQSHTVRVRRSTGHPVPSVSEEMQTKRCITNSLEEHSRHPLTVLLQKII